MPNVEFKIIEELSVISESRSGRRKELNLISWNNGDPVYDLRTWYKGHGKPQRGITLSADEVRELQEALSWLDLN